VIVSLLLPDAAREAGSRFGHVGTIETRVTTERILARVVRVGVSNFVFLINATESKSNKVKDQSERAQVLLVFFQFLPDNPVALVAVAALMEPEGRKIMRVIIAKGRKNPFGKTQFQARTLAQPPLRILHF